MTDYVCSSSCFVVSLQSEKYILHKISRYGVNWKEALTGDWEELNKEIYELTSFIALFQLEARFESSRTSMMVLFCSSGQCLKVLGYFRRKWPSLMFYMILNTTLHNNSSSLAEGLRRSFPPLGNLGLTLPLPLPSGYTLITKARWNLGLTPCSHFPE